MAWIKYACSLVLLLASFSAVAQNDIKNINDRLEKDAREATARYATSVDKPMPELQDYRYSMKMDVAKTIHMSQNVAYCGNVKKLMSYEDSQGELHLVRYLVSGTCRNNH